ncbi:ketopantoate reductase family protein [Deferrisoma camini]|uniref:ketopantoate reductase family protein n=1 Tax=Deferrisoma camini TaxID=1035120 RepID=UPI00046C994B|nr:2-dehydropantoate 2-reductase [Deferrisoma camini]
MKTAIIGAGAMGCLFGAHLARAGVDVTLIDIDADEVATLRARGVRLHQDGRVSDVAVAALTDPAEAGPADLVIVFVKAHQTRSVLPGLPPLLGPETRVLTLQNGLGAADVLAEAVPPDRLLVGVTAQGATQLGRGEVRHGGRGETLLGPYRPGPDRFAQRAAAMLTGAGLPARAVADPWPPVWKKLAVNCAINPVTALTGIRNGPVAAWDPARELAADAAREAAAVARAEGVDLGDPEDLVGFVTAVARATAENRSSMGQDVDRRAPTEIEFICGAVVRRGEARGVPTPVNRTLWRLIRTLELGYRTAAPIPEDAHGQVHDS